MTQRTADQGWLTRENALALLLISSTCAVIVLCFRLTLPFLPALAFGLALALCMRRPHRALQRKQVTANTAATVCTLLVALVIVAPAWFLTNQLIAEAAHYAQELSQKRAAQSLDKTLETTAAGPLLRFVGQNLDFRSELAKLLQSIPRHATELLSGGMWMAGQFLLTLFVVFYCLRDQRQLLGAMRHLVPLSDPEIDEVLERLDGTIHATVVGTLAMGAIQGALGGIAFWFLGLPAPLMWGVLMGLLAVIPVAGAFVVWVPAAIGLAMRGDMMSAALLVGWGLFVIGLIDNLLYPVVVGRQIHMHSLAVLIGLLGGIAVFGAAGILIGPMILSLADALVDVWTRRTRHGRAAEEGVHAREPVTREPPREGAGVRDRALALEDPTCSGC